MVTTSGFTHTPVTRLLILTLISTTLLTSILTLKHHLPIKPTPHLWPYLQFSRILTFQLAYMTSSELLFGVVLAYQMRVLERIWGSRKYASFIVMGWIVVGIVTVILGVVLKVLTLGRWGVIPSGVTGLLFALLAVWRGEVPRVWAVKVVTGLGDGDGDGVTRVVRKDGEDGDVVVAGGGADGGGGVGTAQNAETTRERDEEQERGIMLSDKFTTYILAAQLALSQFPYQLLPALVGWVVGSAWREELLPMGMIRWRLPGWMVGEDSSKKANRGQYEGLRRRLEEEGGVRDGMRETTDGIVRDGGTGQSEERRGFGTTIRGYFTGS